MATSSSFRKNNKRRRVGYRQSDDDGSSGGVLWLVEDNTMVLLGGEVWPSAFAMAEAIEARLLHQAPPSIIVELGAGVGLCGLVAASAVLRRQEGPCRVYLTDESPELAAVNAGLFRTEWLGSLSSSAAADVTALELLWGDVNLPSQLVSALVSSQPPQPASSSLLVLGSEVTPMAKTQPALVATLRALLLHPAAVHAEALLTVDACVLQFDEGSRLMAYPRVCPAAQQGGEDRVGRQCAGHGFLTLVQAGGDLEWSVTQVWTAEEVRAACHARRVRDVGDAIEDVDFTAATAPEGLVLVAITLKGRGSVK